uniref:Uncharacterized protein n=1 Tax=Trichuris muris TaxID=70415 RepID=A0A5S6QNB2_TRIMR
MLLVQIGSIDHHSYIKCFILSPSPNSFRFPVDVEDQLRTLGRHTTKGRTAEVTGYDDTSTVLCGALV